MSIQMYNVDNYHANLRKSEMFGKSDMHYVGSKIHIWKNERQEAINEFGRRCGKFKLMNLECAAGDIRKSDRYNHDITM